MNNLSMNDATFKNVIGPYMKRPLFFGMDASDLEDVFNLVHDLLAAECDAIRAAEPYARNTIREYESAATTVDIARYDFCDAFDEWYK